MKSHVVGSGGKRGKRIMAGLRRYRARGATYSGETFDLTQQIANALTEAERIRGGEAPTHGYSDKNFKLAERLVRRGR